MRVPLKEPITKSQAACALLLAHGHNYADIGERLGTSQRTAKFHIMNLANKIPGDLPAQMKVVCWVRGAAIGVLMGSHIDSDMEELIAKAG